MTSSTDQTPVPSAACPPCPPASRLDAFFDHEVPDTERRAIEAHLATCAACQQALEQIAAASSLMKSIELPALSQISRARLMHGLADSAPVRDRWILPIRVLTTAAAAVFILATCLIIYQLRHSSPGSPGGNIVQPIVGFSHGTPGSSQVVPTVTTNPAQP